MDIPVAVTPAVEVFKEMEMLVLEGSATRQALTAPSPSPTTSTLSLNEITKPGVDRVIMAIEHPFAMEMVAMEMMAMEMMAILVHSLHRFSLCTKMAVVAVAKLLVAML